MNNWALLSLDEIFKVSSGINLPEAKFIDGEHAVYGGNGIVGYNNQFTHEGNELIIGRVGAQCGNVYVTEARSWVTDNALIVFFKKYEPIINFWYYTLKHLNLRKHAFESAQPVITGGILKNIEVNVPPIPQQQKIAKILSTCDTVISQTEQAIKKYQAIKQGMMTDLFTRGIDVSTGKLRPSYEEQPDLYKQSEVGWISKEWSVAKLGDYTIKNMYGPRFSANDYDTKGNVRTIRGMDFSKDGNILYKQAPIASLPVSKVSTHLLVEDDVVIVTTADCGLTAVYEEQGFPYIPSAYSVKFRFAKDLNPYFFKYFMQTNFAHRLVNKYVRQGTLGNLPGSDILIFKIIIPHFDEQKRIVEKLDVLANKIRTEQETLKKYQQIKAGLMQDLLTGKVQVQTDDVA